MLHANPTYRSLVYGVTCAAGESIVGTKLISLFALLSSIFLLAPIFKSPSFVSTSMRYRILNWLPIVHPIVLFPFFYASQISTSLTLLWTAAVIRLFCSQEGWRRTELQIALGLLLAGLGQLIRVEAIYLAMMIFGSWTLFRLCFQGISFSQRIKSFSLLTPIAARFLVFVILFLALNRFIPATFRSDPMGIAPDFGFALDYPQSSHLAVQIWASGLYLKGFLFPIGSSFFGPWTDWIWIHDRPQIQSLLTLLAVVLGLGLFALSLLGSRVQVRLAAAGLFCFLAFSWIQSLFMRADWYALSRAEVASVVLCFFIQGVFQSSSDANLEKTVTVYKAVLLYFFLNSFALLVLHYGSYSGFVESESMLVGAKSPAANLEASKLARSEGRLQDALEAAHRAYGLIPQRVLSESTAALSSYTFALYDGYRVAEQMKRPDLALGALKVMMNINNYHSTLLCLENASIPLEACTTKSRLDWFCNILKIPGLQAPPDPKRIRKPIAELCPK